MKEFNEYYQKAKRTLRGRPKPRYVFGLACEMLAKDWLKERGWKVYGSFRTFTRFTKVYGSFGRLTKRQRHFIKNFLICDFYIYNKKRELFAIVEVKSTQRRTNTFDFASESQRKYYEKALELGIPIKFIFIKILNNKVTEIKMCNYPKDLAIFERKVRPKKEIEPKTKPIRKGITKKDVEEMKALYAQGFTQNEIAKKFGIKASTVRYHLKK
ncbi:MAG: helix-turn-helix domain-containing protein [Candidatus Bathyarchaeota archaeon]|nr:helix-turn-helix domain-containing protein [Candidatus Bathyarchaeota archaeon]